jgi:hypothetical protein
LSFIGEIRVKVAHNGVPFEQTNVDAICGVRSTKKPEQGTLGFLGIGFKSVFKITDCPEIHSGKFSFKFDKAAHSDPSSLPWQIMPLWVDEPRERIDPELTTFILPFKDPDLYQQTVDELRRLDVPVFLFLRWLRRLTSSMKIRAIWFLSKMSGKRATFSRSSETIKSTDSLSFGVSQKSRPK